MLLASIAFSHPAAAQPRPALEIPDEREIAISGAPDEPPVIVYAAPNEPVMVSFDAPLKKDALVTVQGADVHPHPFRPNALIITPSTPLDGQGSLPVLVPMVDGDIPLKLAFSPTNADRVVRVIRRVSSARPAMTQGELEEALSLAAGKSLRAPCASTGTTDLTRRIDQTRGNRFDAKACGGGAFAYVRVTAKANCRVAAARITRGKEPAEVVLLRRFPERCPAGTCWLVVVRAPPGDGRGFALELLADDGEPCGNDLVDLTQ